MRVSHAAKAAVASFDGPNLVSAAGLLPVMRLAERAGLRRLADTWLSVPVLRGYLGGGYRNASGTLAGMVRVL